MSKNLLIVHGGAPSAVLNASLFGAIVEAKKSKKVSHILGAIGGVEGILNEKFANLDALKESELDLMLQTPGTVIGTSRYAVRKEDYTAMVKIFVKQNIGYVLLNGGNGTMNTCGILHQACRSHGINVIGIPKTMDNDIAITDHTPGFGSSARYIAATTAEVGEDVNSLPIHVCIIEAMGRNAGWTTAASALARRCPSDAPHLIYLPERPFNETEFLEDVLSLHEKKGGLVIVVSEGLKKENGEPLVEPIMKTDRAVYFGEVGAYLARLITDRLGIKARNEKPGICGRASMPWVSDVDRVEAILAGKEASKAAILGKSGYMIGFARDSAAGQEYKIRINLIPIEEVMLYEKTMPKEFINERGNDVTDDFITWCRPLIGKELPDMLRIRE